MMYYMKKFFSWIKKYFIPHEENDYKPHSLSHSSMLAVLFVIIFIQLFALISMFSPVTNRTNFLASVLPAVLTSITNEKRAENAVAPLAQNDLLQKAAQLKAEDMATRGYFAHTSPDGKLPWYWFNSVGYAYSYAGENLAVNFFDSKDVAEAWMDSPAHRANIVKKDFTEIGIGIAHGMFEGVDTVFVVQFFGTPSVAKATPIIAIKNTTKEVKNVVTIVATTNTVPAVLIAETPKVTTDPWVLSEVVNVSAVAQSSIIHQSPVKLFIQKIITSPRSSSALLHQGIFVFVVLALLLAIFIKREIQHPLIIARGVALISLIVFLGFLNIHISNIQIVVPMDDIYASTVEVLPK